MTDPESNLVEYTYDKAKRLETVKKGGTTEATYGYNELGLRTAITYGNSSVALYYYNDTTRWLDGLYNQTSTSTIISSFDYTHDLVGNRTSMTLANGDVISYTYDFTYQLTLEQRTGSVTYTNSWTYDKVGNRKTQDRWDGAITTTTTYDYNDANQLISSTDTAGTTTYAFDANGNQTGKTFNGNTWQWGYDYENRQISYTDPVTASNDATYTYDAYGSRIAKTVNSVMEKYLLDGANVIVDYDGSNNVKAQYVTPFLDQNLLVITDGNKYYYMMDGLGSVSNMINTSEAVQNTYDYYAFGEVLNKVEGVSNRYRFTSREWDSESQTNYFRARNQDPRIGRFLSTDPIEYTGGINLYVYTRNNPVNHTDSSGLLPLPVPPTYHPPLGTSIFSVLKVNYIWPDEKFIANEHGKTTTLKREGGAIGSTVSLETWETSMVQDDCPKGCVKAVAKTELSINMYISRNLNEGKNEVIKHELQHAMWDFEGFNIGKKAVNELMKKAPCELEGKCKARLNHWRAVKDDEWAKYSMPKHMTIDPEQADRYAVKLKLTQFGRDLTEAILDMTK